MRITALAVALLLAIAGARTTLGQAPASAKILGASQPVQQPQSGVSLIQRRMAAQAACVGEQQPAAPSQQMVMLVPQQLADGQQALFIVPQQAAGGDIQLVGHHHVAAACPCNQQYGGPWNGGNGGPWSGGYAYGSPYDNLHPGQPWRGGHYGAFGGAHRTPGYPHHHLHREYVGPQGPPSAQVAYPYYTVRGPRDFLMDNPPSIGR